MPRTVRIYDHCTSVIINRVPVTFKNTLYSKSNNPTPNFPVLAIRLYKYLISVPHHLQKFAQMCLHCISDAILPSHPLTPFSPSALNLSQDQGLSQWVSCSYQMTQILEFQLQHQSFHWVFRVDFPEDWLVWSPCCPRDSQESLNDHR